MPALAEALGYLGGMLAAIGLVVGVAEAWPDLAFASRLAVSGGLAAALLGGGSLIRPGDDPALLRLRSFLWLAATAAAALFAGVVAADGLGTGQRGVVVACGAAVTGLSAALWQWRDGPVHLLTMLGGFAATAGAVTSLLASAGAVGLAVWVVGAGYLTWTLWGGEGVPAVVTSAAGAVVVVTGAGITTSEWPGVGLPLAVVTAWTLVGLAALPGAVGPRAERTVLAVVGTVAAVQATPSAIGYFAGERGGPTGLVVAVAGVALVLAGSRDVVRAPRLAEGLGCAAVLAGAAVTAAQWPDVAPLLGVAAAVGLIGWGTRPGRVLLSLFGALGLLLFLPWTMFRLFPGEGRAPLLIMVSGVVIAGVAVLVARLGGRFRQELRPGRGSASAPAPPAPPVSAQRSTAEVVANHLRLVRAGDVEADIAANYAAAVTLLTPWGVLRGHDGVRELRARLDSELGPASFSDVVDGTGDGLALSRWKADGARARVRDGVDCFVVQDGLIVGQAVTCTVEPVAAVTAPGP